MNEKPLLMTIDDRYKCLMKSFQKQVGQKRNTLVYIYGAKLWLESVYGIWRLLMSSKRRDTYIDHLLKTKRKKTKTIINRFSGVFLYSVERHRLSRYDRKNS